MDLTLDSPVRFIPHVGPVMATRLERLGIYTVEQLLYHIPSRYDDFSLVSPIARVQPGETVTVTGVVETIKNFYTKTGKKVQEARVSDTTGKLSVIWFNQTYLLKIIHPGDTVHLSGTVNWFGNKIVLNNPQYEIISNEGGEEPSLHTGRLVPIYPQTEGVSSKWLRSRVAFLLTHFLPNVLDFLPSTIIQTHHLMDIKESLRSIHFPKHLDEAGIAKRRLAFDELLTVQLRSLEQKRIRETEQHAYTLSAPDSKMKLFFRSLPFSLTDDQKRAIEEILSDLARTIPMNRLFEGDVGSGKTVVAAAAMYAAHLNGYQSILMAPTQILAEQHYQTIQKLLSRINVPIDLMTGNTKTISKSAGKSSVIVGTHALLSDAITYTKLALVIVDEQHRFGVTQRAKLMEKNTQGKTAHLLTMTATPIPRTLAKTVFGALDLSVLREMPKGRLPIKTWVVPEEKRTNAYTWIKKQIQETRAQAFIICPLIDESEAMSEVKAVKEEYTKLKSVFSDFSIGLLHGKMKPKEKTRILADFHAGKDSILVATPVVEVGIDVPNATIMFVEGADRFGLGQLHQLRGRVGRGAAQSYCLLFTNATEEKTLKRLKALETIHDGPALAEVDLALRGPGEIFGTRQHGVPNLKIAAFSDVQTINETHAAALQIMKDEPNLLGFPLLREKLERSKIEDDITQD
jgi:ATP-dependent DNA helicase RecG